MSSVIYCLIGAVGSTVLFAAGLFWIFTRPYIVNRDYYQYQKKMYNDDYECIFCGDTVDYYHINHNEAMCDTCNDEKRKIGLAYMLDDITVQEYSARTHRFKYPFGPEWV